MNADIWSHLFMASALAGAVGGIGVGLLACLLREGAIAARLIDRIPLGPEEAPGRGMGHCPMVDLSRATCPMPSGGECPARRATYADNGRVTGGDAGRRGKHGAGTRPAASAFPGPHSRLGDAVPQAFPLSGSGGDCV